MFSNFVEHDVAAFGTQGHFNRIRQNGDAGKHLLPCVIAKSYFFSSHLKNPLLNQTAGAAS